MRVKVGSSFDFSGIEAWDVELGGEAFNFFSKHLDINISLQFILEVF